MLVIFLSLLLSVVLSVAIIRIIITQGQDRDTEIYTCRCGSGSHHWISTNRLECNKCGMIKEVNPNGIIVG